MMSSFYLTPASISYLNQFLLTASITVYLAARVFVWKNQARTKPTILLISFFASVSALSALLFFEASLLPAQQLKIVYLENMVLGIILIFLLQFAYHFPAEHSNQKNVKRLALALTIGYTLWEAGFAVWRFSQLRHGQVEYRPDYMDYAPAIGFIWVIYIFARGTLQTWKDIASHRFAIIFSIPLFLITLNILRSYYFVSTAVYHAGLSVGILFALFLFVLNFLSSQPEITTFSAKFSGAILTCCLAVFGVLAWVATPVHAAEFSPAIIDHRSILFSPNNSGGYKATEIPFVFQTDLGEILPLTDSSINPTEKINFEFPFFEQQFQEIYISNDGVIGMGADLDYKDFQFNFTKVPAILPLLLDLDPEASPNGKIYLRRETDQLVITYNHVPAFYQPEQVYTFQIVLYSNGKFSITYNGLPERSFFLPNDRPAATPWAIGIKPAQAPYGATNFLHLPLESGPQGLIQDIHLSFRQRLHHFLLPLAAAIIFSSLVLLIGIPLLIHYTLAHPLRSLLNGVDGMNQGKLNVVLPIQFNDEIGYLTNSFNNLSAELNRLIQELETRVSDRTSDLLAANEQLLQLTVAVEQSPSTIVITDIHANIEYVNPAFTRATGYTFEEVKGRNPRILKSGLTPPETYKTMWSELTAGREWRGDFVNKKKDNTIFWEHSVISPIYDDMGVLSKYVAVKEDITAQKITEQALRESEEQYRQLFELESDAILVIRNSDGRILEANSATSTLYGYSHEELLNLRNTDLSAEPESTQKATQTPFPINLVVNIPLRWHRKRNGITFAVSITARFITWKGGESVHIAAIRDITEQKQIEEELIKLSVTDPLTEVSNRRHFYIQAEHIFSHIQPPDTLAILMLDIDHFKQVNDRYGHAAGDVILRQLAKRINQKLRPTDILARYGGEEFVILLPRTSSEEAEQITKRIWQAVKTKPFDSENRSIPITVSIGIAELSKEASDLDTLMRYADDALYHAKQTGRNRWMIWKKYDQRDMGDK